MLAGLLLVFLCCLRFAHAVADAGLGEDVLRAANILAQLTPQPFHVSPQVSPVSRTSQPPYPLHQVVKAQHQPGVDRQLEEQPVFGGSQIDRPAMLTVRLV